MKSRLTFETFDGSVLVIFHSVTKERTVGKIIKNSNEKAKFIICNSHPPLTALEYRDIYDAMFEFENKIQNKLLVNAIEQLKAVLTNIEYEFTIQPNSSIHTSIKKIIAQYGQIK